MFHLHFNNLLTFELTKRYRKPKGQSGMDNPETLVTLGTQDTKDQQKTA